MTRPSSRAFEVRPAGGAAAEVTRCWAAFAALGAGLIHLAVVHEHVAEWWPYAVFFAVGGTAQVGWALVALASDNVPLPRGVVAAHLTVAGAWVASRTTGLPMGPAPWTPEPVGTADAVCTVLEAVVVLLVVASTARRKHLGAGRSPGRAPVQVAYLALGALAMAAVTTPALAATEAGEHAHPHGGHATDTPSRLR